MTIYDLLDEFRATAQDSSDQGKRFERLMQAFFQTDPLYRATFSVVCPHRRNPRVVGVVSATARMGISLPLRLLGLFPYPGEGWAATAVTVTAPQRSADVVPPNGAICPLGSVTRR